jgi:hypothetical protein
MASDTPDPISAEPGDADESAPYKHWQLSAQQIFAMIQESAYYKAEKRGFFPGYEEQDWTEAEAEIKAKLRAR